MTEKWVTLQQAAVALGVSESTIRRRRDAGELQSKQENRRHLIKMDTGATPNGATLAPDDANMTPNNAAVTEELRQQLTDKNQQIEDLKAQLQIKDQQFDKLQQALDQEQQLHAVSQKTIDSQRLQLDESQRPKPLIARLKAVFVAE
jgi:hypothetical protein